jgi:hypothetical protein
MILLTALLAIVAAGTPADAAAQQPRVIEDDEWCRGSHSGNEGEEYCEVREYTLDARDRLSVDATPNGGISVEGWDRNEILVRAKVHARARSESDAVEMSREIDIGVGSTIEADGPRTGRNEGWSVSFRIYVPTNTSLDLKSTNGGIGITDVYGDIEFKTTNGGVHLERLAGDVYGRTTNGSLKIVLDGSGWEGDGMDVRTTNGGVRVTIPENYNAHLETGTVNGSFQIDFPVTVSGRIDRRNFNVDLGSGGKTIKVSTTNGGVVVERG